MYCSHCGGENRDRANFCKSCGKKLSASVISKDRFLISKITKNFGIKSKFLGLIEKTKNLPVKKNYIVLGIVVVAGVLVFGFQFGSAYYKYSESSGSAAKMFADGDYKGALEKLNTIDPSKLFPAFKNKLTEKIALYSEVSKNESIFQTAKTEHQNGNLDTAKELLVQLSEADNYPKLSDVLRELNAVNEQISEGKVAGAKEEASLAAERAKIESDNRQRAEAAASKSAAQAAANQAAAAAAQQQAAANAAAAAAAAQQHAQALRTSFRNEIVDAYNSFNQAYKYYGSGIQYSNNSESVLAITQMNSAKALLNSASNIIDDIGSRYSGLPNSYYTAAGYMMGAINSLKYACDLVVQTEGTSLDYSSTINSSKNSALNSLSYVTSFLNSN